MRPLSLCLILTVLAGCGGGAPTVDASYDRTNDQTSVRFWPPIDVTTDELVSGIVMHAMYTCTGRMSCTPDVVKLNFRAAHQTGNVFTTHPALRFVADGRTIDVGPSINQGTLGLAGRAESLWFDVSRDVFHEIAFATDVSGRIGDVDFIIPNAARAIFRELDASYGKTVPPAP
jgi:hypothetical protein